MDADRALSFGAAAADYDAVRPSYPSEAAEWVTTGIPGRRVADVGAGTGKLTRVLAGLGLQVTAVEPDPGMRALLTGAPVVDGRGETLPFPDTSLDAVTYGQSFHWTDHDLAYAEAARVLRPGGVVGLLWNFMDNDVAWVRELNSVTGSDRGNPDDEAYVAPVSPSFAPAESHRFLWERTLTADQLLTLAGTWSWVATRTPDDRSAVLAEVRRIALEVAGDGEVGVPMVTWCVRSRRV